MRIRLSATIAGIALIALGGGVASAQQHQGTGTHHGGAVSGVDQAHTIDCRGQAADVSGSGNAIAYVGDCPALSVSGTDNQISVTLRPGGSVSVSGVDNVIRWRMNGLGRPRIKSAGVGNRVTRLP